MKTWKVYFQLNGPEQSVYNYMDFQISDEQYEMIQTALADGKPLCTYDFIEELCRKAEDAIDYSEYVDTDFIDEPQREDYEEGEDGDAEFEEAMSDYECEVESAYDEWFLADLTFDDPGDPKRFQDAFVGRLCPDKAAGEEHSESFEFNSEGETCVYYQVTVAFGPDGTVTDVSVDRAEGLEWSGHRNSGFGDAYPDYDFLRDELMGTLPLDS